MILSVTGFLCNEDTDMSYYWFINDTNYGSTNDTSFDYTFSSPGISTIEVLVLAKIANPDNNAIQETNRNNELFESSVRNTSSLKAISRLDSPPFVKNGLFRIRLDSREPMTYVNYTGNIFIRSKFALVLVLFIISLHFNSPTSFNRE